MNEMYDADWRKCERVSEILDVIYGVTRDFDAGNYRFPSRYPGEHAEYRRLASEFKASNRLELARLGFRMDRMLLELNETDKTFQKFNNGSRQTRKQLDLFQQTLTKLIDAVQALPIGGERYAV
jgi:hypothetical protein